MTRLLLVLGLAGLGAGLSLGVALADDELAAPLAEAGRIVAQAAPAHGGDGLIFLGCFERATECADAARRKGVRMELFHPHAQACRGSQNALCCAGRKK